MIQGGSDCNSCSRFCFDGQEDPAVVSARCRKSERRGLDLTRRPHGARGLLVIAVGGHDNAPSPDLPGSVRSRARPAQRAPAHGREDAGRVRRARGADLPATKCPRAFHLAGACQPTPGSPSACGGDGAPEVCKEIVPACEIEFLGGFYRFPLPRCQVWSVHLQQSGPRLLAITKELLRIARVSPGDSALLGLSLYRAVGLPAGLLGFLALTPGHDPAELLATRWGDHPPDVLAHAEWQALQVRWTGGHTDSGTSPVAISSSRYPRAAFWARSHAAPGPARASMADRSPASHGPEAAT